MLTSSDVVKSSFLAPRPLNPCNSQKWYLVPSPAGVAKKLLIVRCAWLLRNRIVSPANTKVRDLWRQKCRNITCRKLTGRQFRS